VAVAGHSMEPTLRDGDWLLVDTDAYRRRQPQAGELVVATHPRMPAGLVIKRVAVVHPDGRLSLAGDHPAHADEPALAGLAVPSLLGRPWFRYWPPRRIGRIR
jgi:nickel-type superoxide dismutase maturation protease